MEDCEIPMDGPSDWQPITNKADLAVLGKLGEEVCEAGKALFRTIIQGLMEADPGTGKINKVAIEDEIADIKAMMRFAEDRFGLNTERMAKRTARKYAYKAPWFLSLAKDDAP